MSNYSDSFFDKANINSSWYKIYHLILKNSKVLDIGSSSGNFGEVLIKEKGCEVDSIEMDEADAKLAAKKLGKVWVLNVETDSLGKIPHGYYDYIYFGDVIEHLVTPSETLKRVRPLLNKEGAVLFSIPNMAHLMVRLELLVGKFDHTETGLLDKTHLHFYTQKEVLRVFEEAGYSVDHLDFVRKDYPKKLIEQFLKEHGLVVTGEFYKRMSATDASAFQFVGRAIPSKVKKHKLPEFGPIDMFEKFHTGTIESYKKNLDSLTRKNVGLKVEIKEAQRLIRYKTEHPYRSLAGHLKRKIKS
jgi:2-polyprenyl-3-methyl-5-hydroxy-6-metoxy-1,4-benzoquinol methylase